MPFKLVSIAAAASLAFALGITPAPAQQPDWDRDIPWIDAGSVLESLPPEITDLGRTPPNDLPGESTDELQELIDEAHDDADPGEAAPGNRRRPLPRQAD
ncbi:hypothetical protein [Salinarimonas rosea]|uniref:hypothetical protein n=1 Tax=Salinarimonas rosea TaxID=552063 RepID=UPI00040401F0|nr:hypothetical protein [Salinarimonas rosea]